jgi:hypothetical protein
MIIHYTTKGNTNMTLGDEVAALRARNATTYPELALKIVQTYSAALIEQGLVDISAMVSPLNGYQADQVYQLLRAGGLDIQLQGRDERVILSRTGKPGIYTDLLLGITNPRGLKIKQLVDEFFAMHKVALASGSHIPLGSFGDYTEEVAAYMRSQGLHVEDNMQRKSQAGNGSILEVWF